MFLHVYTCLYFKNSYFQESQERVIYQFLEAKVWIQQTIQFWESSKLDLLNYVLVLLAKRTMRISSRSGGIIFFAMFRYICTRLVVLHKLPLNQSVDRRVWLCFLMRTVYTWALLRDCSEIIPVKGVWEISCFMSAKSGCPHKMWKGQYT